MANDGSFGPNLHETFIITNSNTWSARFFHIKHQRLQRGPDPSGGRVEPDMKAAGALAAPCARAALSRAPLCAV